MRAWFSGRTPACQVGDGISIIPARTTSLDSEIELRSARHKIGLEIFKCRCG